MPVERVPMVHPNMAATAVAVEVGKNKAVLSMTSADRHRLFGPAEFAMTAPALAAVRQWVGCAADGTGQGWGGGAGHYHGRCWDRGVAGRLGSLGAQSGSGQ